MNDSLNNKWVGGWKRFALFIAVVGIILFIVYQKNGRFIPSYVVGIAILSGIPFYPKPIREFIVKLRNQPYFTQSGKKCPNERLVIAYAKGELFKQDMRPIEMHLSDCKKCKKMVGDIQINRTS